MPNPVTWTRLPCLAGLFLCACGGGGSDPIDDVPPELLACRARFDSPFQFAEVALRSSQNLGRNRLADRTGTERHARLHPDGNTVVFSRERSNDDPDSRELIVAVIDGSRAELRLTENNVLDDEPCWSPDGARILFASQRSGPKSLWLVHREGGISQPFVTPPAGESDGEPDWCRATARVVWSRRDLGSDLRRGLPLFALGAGLFEFYSLTKKLQLKADAAIAYLCAAALFIGFVFDAPARYPDMMLLTVAMFVAMVLVTQAFRFQKDFSKMLTGIGVTILGVLYVAFLGGFLVAARMGFDGRVSLSTHLLGYFFVVIFASDIGAYLAGRALGKHKLAPAISPGKTVEGLVGGLLFAAAGAAIATATFFHELPYQLSIPLALVLAAVGVLGDLASEVLRDRVAPPVIERPHPLAQVPLLVVEAHQRLERLRDLRVIVLQGLELGLEGRLLQLEALDGGVHGAGGLHLGLGVAANRGFQHAQRLGGVGVADPRVGRALEPRVKGRAAALLLVGRRDIDRQQLAQRIDRQVHLAAFLALMPIVPGPRTAFGAGLQRASVENGRRRLFVPALRQAQQRAQIEPLAVVEGTDFSSGVIEAEIAGTPAPGAGEGARGFVGIAFRLQPDMRTYDAFYLRPTNGRAEDQERRPEDPAERVIDLGEEPAPAEQLDQGELDRHRRIRHPDLDQRAGQVAKDDAGQVIGQTDLVAQFSQVCVNLQAAVNAAGGGRAFVLMRARDAEEAARSLPFPIHEARRFAFRTFAGARDASGDYVLVVWDPAAGAADMVREPDAGATEATDADGT